MLKEGVASMIEGKGSGVGDGNDAELWCDWNSVRRRKRGGGGGVEGQLRRAAGWKQVNAAPKYEAAHQCLELAHSDNRVQWGPVQELLIWLHT